MTLCCGLLGIGAYLHKNGFDDIMQIPQLYDSDNEEDNEERKPLRTKQEFSG